MIRRVGMVPTHPAVKITLHDLQVLSGRMQRATLTMPPRATVFRFAVNSLEILRPFSSVGFWYGKRNGRRLAVVVMRPLAGAAAITTRFKCGLNLDERSLMTTVNRPSCPRHPLHRMCTCHHESLKLFLRCEMSKSEGLKAQGRFTYAKSPW